MTISDLPTTTIGLAALVVAMLGSNLHLWLQYRFRGQPLAESVEAMRGRVDEVHEQVSNKHDSNLRDDVDAIMAIVASNQARTIAIERDITGLRGDMSGVRYALTAETQRSITVDADLARRIDALSGTPPDPPGAGLP